MSARTPENNHAEWPEDTPVRVIAAARLNSALDRLKAASDAEVAARRMNLHPMIAWLIDEAEARAGHTFALEQFHLAEDEYRNALCTYVGLLPERRRCSWDFVPCPVHTEDA